MPTSSVSAYGKDRNKLIVVAVGGNALLTERQRGTFEEQMENVEYCSTELCKIIQDGYQLVLTHGQWTADRSDHVARFAFPCCASRYASLCV